MLSWLKVNGSDENRVRSLIFKSGLGHFFNLVDDNWLHGCGNLLHFFAKKN